MPPLKAPLRASGPRATNTAVTLTDRDIVRLKRIGLYTGVRASTIARYELPPTLWAPWHPAASTPEAQDEFRRHTYAIRRRLTRLKHIHSRPAAHVGPLVQSITAWADEPHTWHLTRTGITAAALPWDGPRTLDVHDLAHAQAAADIHMQLELSGIRALSPREVVSKVDRNGDPTPASIPSRVTTGDGQQRATRPDVAVLSPNGHDIITIDIAGYRPKSQASWTQKLTAYRGNSAVRAVWVLCTTDKAAKTVSQAADKALGKPGSFPLRLRSIMPEHDTFLPLDVLNLPSPMSNDLAPLLADDFTDDGLTA